MAYDEDRPGPMVPLRFERFEVPIDHPAFPYLNSMQHDGGIFSFEESRSTVSLRMNDHEIWNLACTLQIHLGREHPNLRRPAWLRIPAMPITFRFEGVTGCHVYQEDADGHLNFLRATHRRNLSTLFEYRCDRVIELSGDAVAMVIAIRNWPARRTIFHSERIHGMLCQSFHEHDTLIAIEAQQLVVIEEQAEGWLREFGEEYMPIFHRFMAARRIEPGVGHGRMLEFVEGVRPK
ncbi:MAG: hypothetical protein ABL949_06770 [Fimbriimonadaceae bacterium]